MELQTHMIIGKEKLATWLMLNLLFKTAWSRNVGRIRDYSSEMNLQLVNTASEAMQGSFLRAIYSF